jgi:hypothetical protein
LRRFGSAEERSDGRGLHIFGWQNSQWKGGTLTMVLEHRDAQIDSEKKFLGFG